MLLNAVVGSSEHDEHDELGPLRRRWIAAMLSGSASQPPSNASIRSTEAALLTQSGFATGAGLLDALSRSNSGDGPSRIDAFLAVAVYLRACGHELAKSIAMRGVDRP